MVEFVPITTVRREKTERDESLQKLKHVIRVGWPVTKEEVLPKIIKYFHLKEEITMQDGIFFKGNRVIVPAALRSHMMKNVHSTTQNAPQCQMKFL